MDLFTFSIYVFFFQSFNQKTCSNDFTRLSLLNMFFPLCFIFVSSPCFFSALCFSLCFWSSLCCGKLLFLFLFSTVCELCYTFSFCSKFFHTFGECFFLFHAFHLFMQCVFIFLVVCIFLVSRLRLVSFFSIRSLFPMFSLFSRFLMFFHCFLTKTTTLFTTLSTRLFFPFLHFVSSCPFSFFFLLHCFHRCSSTAVREINVFSPLNSSSSSPLGPGTISLPSHLHSACFPFISVALQARISWSLTPMASSLPLRHVASDPPLLLVFQEFFPRFPWRCLFSACQCGSGTL